MKSIKVVLFAALFVIVLCATTGTAASSSTSASSSTPKTYRYGGVWLKVIQDLPPTVEVGKVYTVKLEYINQYKNRRNGYRRQSVKALPWIEWGSVSYPHKSSPEYIKDMKSNKRTMKSRKLKPRQSRKVVYRRVSFDKCLPPWGQDWGGQPGDYFYWGLPCASGRYYFRTSACTKGYRCSGLMSYPYERNVFIVPAGSSQTVTPTTSPTPTGPTGPSDPTGPTGPSG